MHKLFETARKREKLLYGLLFCLLLFCNVLTRYAVDDYTYAFSFATGEPLESVWQIFPSMAAHAHRMNGRLTAHFLVQLFMLMPKWVFDVVNSGMFCLQVALICSFGFSKQRSNLCMVSVCCGIWLWELAFGQVNLWQDGSINYLWSVVFLLLFLNPFAKRFVMGTEFPQSMPFRIVFLVLSFIMGSYSEAASAAGIFVAVLLLALDAICNHRRISKYGIVCVAVAVVGYICIYLAPGEWMNKGGHMTLLAMINKFENVTWVYASSFGVLAAAYVVLLVISLYAKNKPVKRIILSIVLVAGSLAANYIMIFAGTYPERAAVASFALLMTAVVTLLPPAMEDKQWKVIVSSAMAVLVLFTLPHVVSGVKDVGITYYLMQKNEKIILECVANGESEAEIAMIDPATKYSPIYGIKYLDVEDCTSWPNGAMAKYYGLDAVIGLP